MISLTSLLGLALTSQFLITNADPRSDWSTKETPHFLIHHEPQLEEVATELTKIAEPIYANLTTRLQWEPSEKIHVVLMNDIDVANGFSTPFPYNTMSLNIAPPIAGSSLDDYDEWLTMLFTHELTHTIHIDMAGGINGLLRYIFGRAVIPNALQPQWLIEGYAVYHESLLTSAGRNKSSLVDMYIRSASLNDDFVPIERATYWNNQHPYGQAAYWYGGRFYRWVAEKYGAEKWREFAKNNAAWIIPAWFNFKTRNIFGKSFARLWAEWREEEKEHWIGLTSAYTPRLSADPIEEEFYLLSQAVWVSAESAFFASASKKESEDAGLYKIFKDENDEWTYELVSAGLTTRSLSHRDGKLYYSKLGRSGRYNRYSDIWEYDLEAEEKKKLTNNQRLHSPALGSKGIYAIQTGGLRSKIVFIPYTSDEAKNLDEDKDYPLNQRGLQILYRAPGFGTISGLNLHPSENELLFSMFKENEYRDLYSLKLSSLRLNRLTQDAYLDYFPTYSPSGDEVVFVSDRELGDTDQGVYNLIALDPKSKTERVLTDTWTGVFYPSLNEENILIGHFQAEGFEAQLIARQTSVREQAQQTQPIETSTPEVLKTETLGYGVRTRDYTAGNTLLPRFLFPFFFYTESDTAIGLLTGATDPVGYHSYTAFGYHLFSPNRPGGGLNYLYRGLDPVELELTGSAGIGNYGKVNVIEDPNNLRCASAICIDNDDYYERTWYGSVGWRLSGAPLDSSSVYGFRNYYFVEDRRPLLSLPADLVTSDTQVPDSFGFLRGSQLSPEKGQQIGVGGQLFWRAGSDGGLAQLLGSGSTRVSLTVEYTPEIWFADFDQLQTILAARYNLKFSSEHSLATRLTAGVQWLDPLFQRSFRLGGSFGDGLFTSSSRRSYPLRGLSEGTLRGEGLVTGSLEYRAKLLDEIPGFGTAPIWIKNIRFSAFTDYGQSFQHQEERTLTEVLNAALGGRQLKKFAFDRFTQSVGAEIGSDISLTYGPPVIFRLGYAYVLFIEGQSVIDDQIDQIYFRIGPSF